MKLLNDFLLEGDEEGGSLDLIGWEVMPRPVDLGVLGIGNMGFCNERLFD